LKKRFRDTIEIVIRFLETSKPIVIALITVVLIMGVITGYKYYKFTENDPRFCELCHLMKETYKSWKKSAHRDTVCQTCHSMNLISQNRLLLGYVVSGAKARTPQKHGRLTPWESCNSCHLDEVEQGGVTLRKSYGHARHVFMEEIECKKCHTDDQHNFAPDEKNCLLCHKDKGVHGIGMEGFACLSCHVYGETTAMPRKERCVKCHKDVPLKGPMSKVDCRNCHKPHGRIKPTAMDCVSNCHANQDAIGRHDRHIDISCNECHKAHEWKVGQEEARSLCSRCHEYKDPLYFIF
jgi:nitrate/TMAO reductase-like tetraheme cytochrome c subunit